MKALLQIYPLRLLAMVLYVQLVAMCINYNLYEFREILIILCWIPIFISLYLLTKNKIIYKIIVTLFFIDGFINLCHWLILKGPVSASSFFILANTNLNEALEFMDLKLNIRFLLLIPYIFLFILALKKVPEIILSPKGKYLIAGVIFISLTFIIENIIGKRFIRKAVPQTTEAIISFSDEIKIYKTLKKRKTLNVDAQISNNLEDEHLFLLIIGESCSRRHMSLYGYHRETTPKLDKRKDIIVYRDVVSPFSNTLNSILTILTDSNLENDISAENNISLIDIFHSAGFKTYWISNQSPIGIWDNGVFNLAQTSDVVVYENNSGNSSFESTLITSYDEILLEPLSSVLKDNTKNKFIIMQLMGSHSSYSKRYPKNFSIYKEYSNNKEKIINEYDNSILYNDYLIDTILNIINSHTDLKTNLISSLIYLSDHGENVYDENNNAGHDYSGDLPKVNVEIPFIVWVSDNYKTINKDKYQTILSNTDLPFVSDDLFHTIIDLNYIETPNFEKYRSIFNKGYNSNRKRILEDGMDYDLK